MLVWHKAGLDSRVEPFISSPRERSAVLRSMKLDERFSLQAVFASGARCIERHPWFQWADIVHLQLLHTVMFFSLRHLARLARKKAVVWTLHDLWPLTGHCIQPEQCAGWQSGCSACPDIPRIMPLSRNVAGLMWKYKRYCYAKADMDIIVSSAWMQARVCRSPLLGGKVIHQLPFSLQKEGAFYSADTVSLRKALGIADDACVILFRNSVARFKRLNFIREALLSWQPSRPVHLVTVDQRGGLLDIAARYPLTELGWIANERLLASMYAMSDIFLTPTHESFCLMALESLACKTPVICLKDSAVEELCQPPDAGLSVPDNDVVALVAALDRLVTSPSLRADLGRKGRELAWLHTLGGHMDRLEEIYLSCLKRRNCPSSAC